MIKDCIFCKIINKQIPADFEYEDNDFVVFKDIHPSAPIHFLIVPKKHIKDISESDSALWDEIRKIALRLSKKLNTPGFRLATNVGDAALVEHLHVHFLAGITKERKL